MRALSLAQPFCWAVVHGGKRIENRSQPITYRGEFLVHASLKWYDKRVASEGRLVSADLLVERMLAAAGIGRPQWSNVSRGAIVGRATIVMSFRFDPSLNGSPEYGPPEDRRTVETDIRAGFDALNIPHDQRGWLLGPHCAYLADVVACEPVPFRGALGFFDVPDSIVRTLKFVADPVMAPRYAEATG